MSACIDAFIYLLIFLAGLTSEFGTHFSFFHHLGLIFPLKRNHKILSSKGWKKGRSLKLVEIHEHGTACSCAQIQYVDVYIYTSINCKKLMLFVISYVLYVTLNGL